MPRGKSTGLTRRKLEAQPSQSTKAARRSGVSRKKSTPEPAVGILAEALTSAKTSRKRATKKLPPAPAPILPEETTAQLGFDVNSIQNYNELMMALQAKKVQITLGNNIIAPENILINYDVAINLNGFSIVSEESVESARVLDIRSGAVTLTGQGKIFAMGPRSVAIRVFGAISPESPDYTTLTIDEGVSIFAPDAYGILISPNLSAAYGLTVNFSGQIFARDGICLASGVNGHDQNLPTVNLRSSASIMADENTGAAIEAAGYGKWQISTAHLRGARGASLRSGILEFSNTQVLASLGAVFQLEDAAEPTLEVTVDGGNYVAEQSQIFAGTSAAVRKFVLKNGDFYSQATDLPAELKSIVEVKKSANLRTDVAEYLNHIAEQEQLALAMTAEQPESMQQESAEPDEVSPNEITTPAETETEQATELTDSNTGENTASTTELLELTDDDTDEDAIVMALTAEKLEPSRPVSSRPVFAPPKPIQPVSEQDAARVALAEAISDIRKLSAEDYDVGFAVLERAIQNAEAVLADPLAELSHIRDAASNLLLAFDGLEERNEFSLSDEELDELFYHGAILSEIAAPYSKSPITKNPSRQKNSNLAKALDYQDLPLTPNSDDYPDATSDFEPDFTVLSDVLNTISELKLENYTEESRLELLQVLDEAQSVLTDMTSPQSAIDEVAASLVGAISKLDPLRALHSPTPNIRLGGPAPTLGTAIPAAMMDEMTPAITWSQGITMIDELEPFFADATTQEKMLRAMKPWIVGMAELATEPMRRLRRSLAAGFRAGLTAYRETRNNPF